MLLKQSSPAADEKIGAWISAFQFGLAIAFTSSGLVQKYVGLTGLLGYSVGVIVAIRVLCGFHARIATKLDAWFRPLILAIMAMLAASFLGLHPIEDGRGPGHSSDRDEGLELAVTRMQSGLNPYYPQNPVAGPLSLLPGAILLSAPFVWLGSVGLQNVFWLGAFAWILGRLSKNRTLPWLMIGGLLCLSPSTLYEFISGGDMISNGAYVACFLCFFWQAWMAERPRLLHQVLTGMLLAIGLASRANFILLLPLVGAAIWHGGNWKCASAAVSLVTTSYLLLVVPFYWWDPSAFTPLMSKNKLAFAEAYLPWADVAILGLTALVGFMGSLWLAFGKHAPTTESLCRWCTWLTLTPMLAAVLVSSWLRRSIDFSFMQDRFGLMYVFLFFLGWGRLLLPHSTDRTPTDESPTLNLS